jgi:hypothetical protein
MDRAIPRRDRLTVQIDKILVPRAFSDVALINTTLNLTRHGGPAEHRQEP